MIDQPMTGGSESTMVDELASACHLRLLDARATVATAESLTGGLVGAALTATPGSSATYRGGIVAYSVDLKQTLLGVPSTVLDRFGPVHADTAEAMAAGVRERLGATYGLSTTGVAGPEPHGDQPVGTVDVAIAGPSGVESRRLKLDGDRDGIRQSTVLATLELLLHTLEREEAGMR